MTDRDLYGGLIRLHLLHHAAESPLYGFSMIEELGRHGYRLSPGTLYPILHGLEKKGYLRSTEQRLGRTARRMYRITPSGRRALEDAKSKVCELFGEMFEGGGSSRRGCALGPFGRRPRHPRGLRGERDQIGVGRTHVTGSTGAAARGARRA